MLKLHDHQQILCYHFLGVCAMHRTVIYLLPFAEVTEAFREQTAKA